MSNPRVKLPSVTSLVARSAKTHIIGADNQLPWRLGTDLRRFRARTMGHAVVMGRKTFESIGRPLPKRVNIVLSRSEGGDPNVLWANSIENALMLADFISISANKKEFFVIGGENIYNSFLPWIDKVFLTEVYDAGVEGDARFDVEFSADTWQKFRVDHFEKSESDDFDFDILCYLRKRGKQRDGFRQKFLESQKRPEPLVSGAVKRLSADLGATQMAFGSVGF